MKTISSYDLARRLKSLFPPDGNVPPSWQQKLDEALSSGTVTAYGTDDEGRADQPIDRTFWSRLPDSYTFDTTQGEASRGIGRAFRRRFFRIYFDRSRVDALWSEPAPAAARRPLKEDEKAEIVAMLSGPGFGDLSRKDQRTEVMKRRPDLGALVRDDDWREIARQVPGLPRGRKKSDAKSDR